MTTSKYEPPSIIAHKTFLSLLTAQGVPLKDSGSVGTSLRIRTDNPRLDVIFKPTAVSSSFVEMDSREASLQTLGEIADFTPKLFAALKKYQEFLTTYDSYSKQFEPGPATSFTISPDLWGFLTPTELVECTPIPKLLELYGYETCIHEFMELLPLEARKIAWTRTLVLVFGNPAAYDALMAYGRSLVNAKG